MTKILELYGEDYPWDVRVEKLLTGLSESGHETHLLCRNLKRSPLRQAEGSIICHRVLPPDANGFLHKVGSIPSPYSPVWRKALQRVHDEVSPDLLVVRDLPLATLGVAFGKKHGIPVIVDFAENHPAMWENVIASDPYPWRSWLMKNPILARKLEKRVARQADMMFVVVEEMRDHLISIGASPAQIRIVSNTPPHKALLEGGGSPVGDGEGLNLVFVGNLTRNRGLQQILEAMAQLPETGLEARFDIVGAGDHGPALKKLAADLGISDKVVFHGWVENQRIPDLIRHCNVGVIPHLKTEHTDTTIPNKLFDFMALGLPVVVSDANPLQRIVAEERCGVHFQCGNIESLVESLGKLGSRETRKVFGANGKKAVERRYHWEFDIATVRDAVSELVPSFKASSPLAG